MSGIGRAFAAGVIYHRPVRAHLHGVRVFYSVCSGGRVTARGKENRAADSTIMMQKHTPISPREFPPLITSHLYMKLISIMGKKNYYVSQSSDCFSLSYVFLTTLRK